MRIVFALFLLAACTPFPELTGTISDSARAAPYPVLTPLPTLPTATGEDADQLAARAAALRARAAQIRQIDIAALQ